LLDEVIVLHDEHFPDVVGMIQEKDVVPSDFVMRDVAIFVREVLEQKNRIRRAKTAKGKPKQISLKTGRKAVIRRSTNVMLRWFIPDCRRHLFSLLRQQTRLAARTAAGTIASARQDKLRLFFLQARQARSFG